MATINNVKHLTEEGVYDFFTTRTRIILRGSR